MNLMMFSRYLAVGGEEAERNPLIQKLIIAGCIVGAIVLLVVFYIFLSLKYIDRITYKREFSEKGSYEGDELQLIETIANRSFLPFFFIDIEYYIFNELQYDDYEQERDRNMQYTRSRFFIVLPYMQIKRRHTIKLKKRGFYQLDTVTFWYGRKQRRISAPAQVYVYPKLTGIDDLPIPSSSMQGDAFSKQWLIKDPFSVSGIREYRFGDPFNSINFKATAKSGKLGFEGIRELITEISAQTETLWCILTSRHRPKWRCRTGYTRSLWRGDCLMRQHCCARHLPLDTERDLRRTVHLFREKSISVSR